MLFEFSLRPLEDVQPWGSDNPKLHWFGLTDGWCWWNAGEQQLFRFSEAWMDRWAGECREPATQPPYVDYQVVRPWEDLLDCLPHILDPVPTDLALRTSNRQEWRRLREGAWQWIDANAADDGAAWNLHYAAFGWWSEREWDAGYLRHPPKIWLWTQGDMFHLCWDNRAVVDNSLPVWEAAYGEITLPVAAFVEEAKSFNDRLMSAMADRIGSVIFGALSPNIEIDLAHLQYEQSDRATWMENALTKGRSIKARTKEDWDKVREALVTVERMCYNNGVEGL